MSAIKNEDLVLQVSAHINPAVWDEDKYVAFVDALCQERQYQKEAIFTALRFLAGGVYANLQELAHANYSDNPKLKEAYGSLEAMQGKLQFPKILSCTLDLATGTGKSYVLYGIAAIMLAEGLVDQVLILCPSNTIERGLTKKLKGLAANAELRDNITSSVMHPSPTVINANQTIEKGCVCVENYHAVLQHVKSSIYDSLHGKGDRTLVLNDETHHVYVRPSESGKWKDFLLNEKFGFRRVVGVSGTCYHVNDYFPDVISRYSLRQAIEDRVVKEVEYVAESPKLKDPYEKWQLIYQRHHRSLKSLQKKNIRPLTIVVTKNIQNCTSVAEELRGFLQETEKITKQQSDEKVLIVTSQENHQRNVGKLDTVDNPQSNVEWVVSVSMLTEGWDVKNVFQIVPHEERAFNSKLLISQVLGRGLRVPENWHGKPPVVTVFNHHSWAPSIKRLVDEILDIEWRISCIPLKKSDCHFDLHNLEYEKEIKEGVTKKTDTFNLFERGYIDLPSAAAEESGEVEYERITEVPRTETMTIRHRTFTSREIADHVHRRLGSIDKESSLQGNNKQPTTYAEIYTVKRLQEILEESCRRSDIQKDKIPDEIRQKFLQAVGVVHRTSTRRVSYDTVPKKLITIKTSDRQKDSCSAAELHKGKSVFCRSDCKNHLPLDQIDFYKKLIDPDGEFRSNAISLSNDFYFKMPFNLVIADSIPERRFIRQLCERENAKCVDGWMKNTAMSFYAIEYAWSRPTTRKRGAPHIKRSNFNPDFFIKKGNKIIVVEIKDESQQRDPSPENIKKYEYAKKHFDLVNGWLCKEGIDMCYYFHMLTPDDYMLFFKKLRGDDMKAYNSHLDAEILSRAGADLKEYSIVKLNTSDYENKGLCKGEIGTIVEILDSPRRGYTVEFHDTSPDNMEKVRTFDPHEIDLVHDVTDE